MIVLCSSLKKRKISPTDDTDKNKTLVYISVYTVFPFLNAPCIGTVATALFSNTSTQP